VTDERHEEQVIQAWNEHRPYLVDLAFRMLDDIGAAEDVVQDAFSRLLRARPGEIEDERGWLIVVTSRLCLDQIRSARSRRERPHDASEIEFVATDKTPANASPSAPMPGDPADRVTLDDNVRLALLVMLQRLSPAERVVFVLHDIFSVPFTSIAQTVGRPAATCRQLARRARQKIEAGQGGVSFGVSFDVSAAEHRQVTEKFIAACARGDLDGLLEVLAPDAWGDFDAGPDEGRDLGVIHGAVKVARRLLHFWGPPATLVTHPVAGQPALLGFHGRDLSGVLVFTMRDDGGSQGGRPSGSQQSQIQAVHVIGDPRKLRFLSSQLA
jgi:RNA polymerase sigma-70 factor, ECF subfamily